MHYQCFGLKRENGDFVIELDKKYYSKFDITRIISARTLQINENAPIAVKVGKDTENYELAVKEYYKGKTPLRVMQKTLKEEQEEAEREIE